MNLERERQDCERLLRTFETLCSLSRRKLKKLYGDIEVLAFDVWQRCHVLAKDWIQYRCQRRMMTMLMEGYQ
jgi:hypothetical protein